MAAPARPRVMNPTEQELAVLTSLQLQRQSSTRWQLLRAPRRNGMQGMLQLRGFTGSGVEAGIPLHPSHIPSRHRWDRQHLRDVGDHSNNPQQRLRLPASRVPRGRRCARSAGHRPFWEPTTKPGATPSIVLLSHQEITAQTEETVSSYCQNIRRKNPKYLRY